MWSRTPPNLKRRPFLVDFGAKRINGMAGMRDYAGKSIHSICDFGRGGTIIRRLLDRTNLQVGEAK